MGTRTPPLRTTLSRARIVAAAIDQIDAHGTAALTIRSLAAELGVSPMALYRHVSSKDELLLAVTDALLAREPPPDPWPDWEGFLTQIASSLRRLFLRYPALVEVFAHQPVTTPTARQRLGAALTVLTAAGFDDDAATRAYAAVHTYVIGFCGLEAARTAGRARPALDPPAPVASSDADLVRRIEGFVGEEQFRFGLDTILAGLRDRSA